jgi:hypothetical protein
MDILQKVSKDKHGIYVIDKDSATASESSTEGFEKIEKIFNFQDTINFLHLFRLLHALRFLQRSAKNGETVGDFAAGYCELPSLCASSFMKFNYYCFEFDYKKLVKASKRKIGSFNRVLVRKDLTKPNNLIPDNFFDCGICLEFAEHVDPTAFMDIFLFGLNRVLKMGAKVLFSTPNIAAGGVLGAWHIHEYTYKEFVNIVEAAGFEVLESFGLSSSNDRTAMPSFPEFFDKFKDMMPSSFSSQFKLINKPEVSREFSLICRKILDPVNNISSKIDISESIRYNLDREEKKRQRLSKREKNSAKVVRVKPV